MEHVQLEKSIYVGVRRSAVLWQLGIKKGFDREKVKAFLTIESPIEADDYVVLALELGMLEEECSAMAEEFYQATQVERNMTLEKFDIVALLEDIPEVGAHRGEMALILALNEEKTRCCVGPLGGHPAHYHEIDTKILLKLSFRKKEGE